MVKVDLTKEEIMNILEDIECSVGSVTTGGRSDEITFDKKNFSVGDYAEQKVEMLGKLYSKLRPLVK